MPALKILQVTDAASTLKYLATLGGDGLSASTPFLTNIPLGFIAALGDVPAVRVKHITGRNTDIDTAAQEDVIDKGGEWEIPTLAQLHAIVSDDVNDALGGTGAQMVEVVGLDTNYDEISEVLNLTGTTPLNTTKLYIRIQSLRIVAAGSTGANEGTITATANTDSTESSRISIGLNKSLQCVYTVPNNHVALLLKWHGGVNKQASAAVDFTLFRRPLGEVFYVEDSLSTNTQGANDVTRKFDTAPELLTAKEDIKVHAFTSANNTGVNAGLHFLLLSTL